MTLIVDILARVARQVSLTAPSSWIAATADEYTEIRDDFLLETVEDVLDRVDMPSPVGSTYTIVGDGSETYSLPSNFRRLTRDRLAVYDTFLDRAVMPVKTDGDWTYLQDSGVSGACRYYRLSGFEGNWSISFDDAPTSSVQVKLSYVSSDWIENGGSYKSDFTDAEDVTLLPRRVLESGIVWRWRERKGLDFANKYQEYELMIARMANDARGRQIIEFGHRTPIRWQDQVPSVIPTS